MKTILVAEDDIYIRFFLTKALQAEGFQIFPVQNGQEALDILSYRPDEINVLVTDVEMPVMNGEELVQEVLRRGVKLEKIIFHTSALREELYWVALKGHAHITHITFHEKERNFQNLIQELKN